MMHLTTTREKERIVLARADARIRNDALPGARWSRILHLAEDYGTVLIHPTVGMVANAAGDQRAVVSGGAG